MKTNIALEKPRMSGCNIIMADRTLFGSVSRIDIDNSASLHNSFVFNKVLELSETPFMNPFVIFSCLSDISYVFHNNSCSFFYTINNASTDIMISKSHKPFPSATYYSKLSFGRFCAFSLEFTNQSIIFYSKSFNILTIKSSIRCHSKIIYADIDSKNSFMDIRADEIDIFSKSKKKETSAFIIYSQEAFFNIPREIFFIAVRNNEWNLNSAFDCRDTQDIILHRSTSRKVISYAYIINNRLSLGFLNNSTSLFYTGNRQLRSQSNLPKFSINKWMEFDIIIDSFVPSSINTQLQSSFINLNGLDYFLSCIDFNFSSGSNIHRNSNVYNYLNLLEGISPPKHECMGIRDATFI